MINNKSVLAIIPARENSKRVKNKNISIVNGKPLIYWTYKEAKKSKYLDEIILTTDSLNIKKIAENFGLNAPFLRPKNIALDKSSSIDVIQHAVLRLKFTGIVVLLQPTSPLRTVEDIDKSIELFDFSECHSVITMCKSSIGEKLSYPLDKNNYVLNENKIKSNEDNVYKINGAVYVTYLNNILKYNSFVTNNTKAFIMAKDRSLDIDTYEDLKKCSIYMKKLKNV